MVDYEKRSEGGGEFEFSTDTAKDSEDYDKSTDTASEADSASF